jgi:hypothetical protein
MDSSTIKWSADDYKNIQSLVQTFLENLHNKLSRDKGLQL